MVFLVVFLIVVVGGLTFVASRPSASSPITFADAQQQSIVQQHLPICLALQSQNIPAGSGEVITKVVGTKIIDVPRGIAYGLFFKSHSSHEATGTIEYDGEDNNTFNFVVKRDGKITDQNQGWKLTGFAACEEKS